MSLSWDHSNLYLIAPFLGPNLSSLSQYPFFIKRWARLKNPLKICDYLQRHTVYQLWDLVMYHRLLHLDGSLEKPTVLPLIKDQQVTLYGLTIGRLYKLNSDPEELLPKSGHYVIARSKHDKVVKSIKATFFGSCFLDEFQCVPKDKNNKVSEKKPAALTHQTSTELPLFNRLPNRDTQQAIKRLSKL